VRVKGFLTCKGKAAATLTAVTAGSTFRVALVAQELAGPTSQLAGSDQYVIAAFVFPSGIPAESIPLVKGAQIQAGRPSPPLVTTGTTANDAINQAVQGEIDKLEQACS
jgi:hypothetical protein